MAGLGRESLFDAKKGFLMFLRDQCKVTRNSGDLVTRDELYAKYKRYCRSQSQESISVVFMGRLLSKMGIKASARIGGTNGIGQKYAYVGLVLVKGPVKHDVSPIVSHKVNPKSRNSVSCTPGSSSSSESWTSPEYADTSDESSSTLTPSSSFDDESPPPDEAQVDVDPKLSCQPYVLLERLQLQTAVPEVDSSSSSPHPVTEEYLDTEDYHDTLLSYAFTTQFEIDESDLEPQTEEEEVTLHTTTSSSSSSSPSPPCKRQFEVDDRRCSKRLRAGKVVNYDVSPEDDQIKVVNNPKENLENFKEFFQSHLYLTDDDEYAVVVRHLFEVYTQYCARNHLHPASQKQIGIYVHSLGVTPKFLRIVKGEGAKYLYLGLAWLPHLGEGYIHHEIKVNRYEAPVDPQEEIESQYVNDPCLRMDMLGEQFSLDFWTREEALEILSYLDVDVDEDQVPPDGMIL
ncbi:uncharacterized protein [Panulirus ornatus]|uniref:uncharacterized protein n=1 Tax=Panulirus ornatus TaxID=150431 RepID=UPI003A8ACD19